jgi:hypothetical protein
MLLIKSLLIYSNEVNRTITNDEKRDVLQLIADYKFKIGFLEKTIVEKKQLLDLSIQNIDNYKLLFQESIDKYFELQDKLIKMTRRFTMSLSFGIGSCIITVGIVLSVILISYFNQSFN